MSHFQPRHSRPPWPVLIGPVGDTSSPGGDPTLGGGDLTLGGGDLTLGGDGTIADLAAAAGYVARICFKTGPPSRAGLELEWTVHHRDQPARPLDLTVLADALGDHAPRTIRPDSTHTPLPYGGVVTVEPGGQVEISTAPNRSLATLCRHAEADARTLTDRLTKAGLRIGRWGSDPHRAPRQILRNRRYAAMAGAFARQGTVGADMMCGTAGLQVCLDAGTQQQLSARWTAAHAVGPVLVALFANSPYRAGRRTGWVSSRMGTWLALDPIRTAPPDLGRTDPVDAWIDRVLDTPPLFVAEGADAWRLPGPVSFGEWIRTGSPRPPTYADLDLHLSTLFPPVRPRGYLEIRYLDAQPRSEWILPAAVLWALFARDETVEAAISYAAPVADRWLAAARHGLADPDLAAAARSLVDLACGALPDTDLPTDTVEMVIRALGDRLRDTDPGRPHRLSVANHEGELP
ncbi:glutamate-cysteine ligase family protein [Solwaraspora sp. WMMD406]|uniref:glutamate-cysteine ligase family protein n=1 Tax=Solwaraspora sp. WMMD406 TaxID=3016095 RepID=UPI0024177483|nr:glutamate-cysteine ligase family protein [Solwaraspora sp. WMMD406]MDG4764720.1 glutamate-cysteine ligase family protein [Solwaraspora sp. WMMD406]